MSFFCFRRTNADYFNHCLIVNQEKVAIIDTGFYCESKECDSEFSMKKPRPMNLIRISLVPGTA
ncbi:hypothetical protein ABH916_002010 [Peribacillus frigoritolerans]